MPVFGPNNVFLGATQVAKAYLGGTLLFDVTGPALDPDALAYITAVETADGEALEAGVREAINDFVVGCKADAIWDALKASCILAGARTLNGCLVPLVGSAPTNFNFVSADYNRKTGLKGNGSTKHLNSNRANNADPQNDNHNAVFLTALGTTFAYAMISAGVTTENGTNLISAGGAEGGFSRNRSSTGTAHGTGLATGLVGASRSASASYIVRGAGVNETISVASDGALSNSVLVYRREGSASNHSDMRASFYSIGEAIDLAALDTRVSALMTALDGAIA